MSNMETPDCPNQRSDGDLLRNKSVIDPKDEEPLCNGCEEEDSKGATKRKVSSQGIEENEKGGGGKKPCLKLEDHGRTDIPAHHARRPPNGFLLFCKRHRDIVSAKNPNLENRGVTKLLGNWWRTLEEDEREKYKELARQNKEIFIANNPQFTWYKLPAPPLRTLVTRPSNRRPPKLEPSLISNAGPITPGKLADESQLGGLTSLLNSSLSPPTTPLNTSPPSPTAVSAPAPPKKRFLLQTRAKQSGEDLQSLSESDEATDINAKKNNKTAKKKYNKKKSWNALKYRKNLKTKWSESFSGKMYLENDGNGPDPWKSENGCTQQQLIEKIVDSSFHSQKSFHDFDVQRTLDYINTEHTYQKNPSRLWQQQKQHKCNKKDELKSVQVGKKGEGSERNIISPNLNNNTIVISETRPEVENGLSFSFNDNNNLIIDYVDENQRKLDQSSIQTNHDRIRTTNGEDGYIPRGGNKCAKGRREDCDSTRRSEDQTKPFIVAQEDEYNEDEDESDDVGDEEEEGEDEDDYVDDEEDEEMRKNCDRDNANFQSILGKVSREIVNMMKERGPEGVEDMAVARFNVRSRSDSDSDGSWYDKSDGSRPGSPGGRRSKRSCKGQRYEQFIKDSVSKKRSKNSDLFSGFGDGGKKSGDNKYKRRKLDQTEDADTGKGVKSNVEKISEFLSKEKEFADKSTRSVQTDSQNLEDLTTKNGTKALALKQIKLETESKTKEEEEEEEDKVERKPKEIKSNLKKKPISKVQLIKDKKEPHVGEFNLNEKIEELPLLSFESFLQKKRQRKKRLLGLKKDGVKNKVIKNRLDKLRGRSPTSSDSVPLVPNKTQYNSGHSFTKPDFADLTTLAETAMTLLSLSEPR